MQPTQLSSTTSTTITTIRTGSTASPRDLPPAAPPVSGTPRLVSKPAMIDSPRSPVSRGNASVDINTIREDLDLLAKKLEQFDSKDVRTCMGEIREGLGFSGGKPAKPGRSVADAHTAMIRLVDTIDTLLDSRSAATMATTERQSIIELAKTIRKSLALTFLLSPRVDAAGPAADADTSPDRKRKRKDSGANSINAAKRGKLSPVDSPSSPYANRLQRSATVTQRAVALPDEYRALALIDEKIAAVKKELRALGKSPLVKAQIEALERDWKTTDKVIRENFDTGTVAWADATYALFKGLVETRLEGFGYKMQGKANNETLSNIIQMWKALPSQLSGCTSPRAASPAPGSATLPASPGTADATSPSLRANKPARATGMVRTARETNFRTNSAFLKLPSSPSLVNLSPPSSPMKPDCSTAPKARQSDAGSAALSSPLTTPVKQAATLASGTPRAALLSTTASEERLFSTIDALLAEPVMRPDASDDSNAEQESAANSVAAPDAQAATPVPVLPFTESWLDGLEELLDKEIR